MAKLDLDDLQTPPHEIVFHGGVYHVPGEVPIPLMVDAIQIRAKVSAAEAAGDEDGMAAGLTELYGKIMGLFRSCDPDTPDLPLSVRDMTLVLGLIATGQAGVELDQAVVETLGGKGPTGTATNRAQRRAVTKSKTQKRKTA